MLKKKLRLIAVLPGISPRRPTKRSRPQLAYLLIVLGSGGHTAEMMKLIRDLDTIPYKCRRYIISSGDHFSAERVADFEAALRRKAAAEGKEAGYFDVQVVSRARQIHQSLLSTPLTAAWCAWDCIKLLRQPPKELQSLDPTHGPFPDIILTNGPATATIMIFASIFLRFVGVPGSSTRMRCVYVESWARVRQLSLSGRILRATGACDRFLVQWEHLAGRGTEFRGQLVA
jgi:beta-1,4-N-acetylglucosaminyltransferase